METYKTRTGEEYVLCLVCNHPCFGGYASHIPCGGVKISELAKLRKNPFYESGKTPPHQITNMLDTTKAKERFIKEFTEPDYGWGSEGYTNKLRRVSQEEILAFLESELLLAHQAGREEMRQECLAAVPEQFRNYIERALEQALTAQKEELKKRIEGKRIVVEEKEKGTYYAQHCNGYNQALDDIITELNHQ